MNITLLWLGEIHGTVEIPKLFGDIVCHSVRQNNGSIVVMLELPFTLQASLDLYMTNDISEDKFLAHPAWSPEWQDGRFSVAMLDLINQLKSIKQKFPQELDIFLVDLLFENSNNEPKSQYLANNISKHLLGDYQKTLVLTGNYHNRVNLQEGNSAATILSKFDPLTLTITASKGNYWGCTGSKSIDCKVNHFDSKQEVKREGILLPKEKKNWHGAYQF
ncbi:hypothetical protein SOPP22_18640 [Shewanella sp. OPT22]|nr:hypothetical protein SOPP22_18640 [Shewanella sp. OPT22]